MFLRNLLKPVSHQVEPDQAQGYVFRSDGRSFQQLEKDGGFSVKNSKNNNIQLHVLNMSSNYVSTSMSRSQARHFCRPFHLDWQTQQYHFGNFLYAIRHPEIYVEPRMSIPYTLLSPESTGMIPVLSENEISSVGPIPLADIEQASQFISTPGLGYPHFKIGETIKNPHFQKHARDWSIAVRTACPDEEAFFNLTDESLMKGYEDTHNAYRFITLNEAKEACAALAQTAKGYDKQTTTSEDPAPYFFATGVPAKFSTKETVPFIIKCYEEFSAANHYVKKNPHTFFVNNAVSNEISASPKKNPSYQL
ncbi:MAG: hypothetical protein H0W64_03140 [Gammaproteobacteria bacterium]|nr:hypothetical protein [Gammaproteobacteria bacterium]